MKGFIKNIQVDFISLVKKGANRKEIIYKSNSAFSKTIQIKKLDEEKMMVYGVVYSPDEIDTQGQYTSAEEIEKAAGLFMKQGKSIMVDKNHNEKTGEGYIVESWIKKDIDPCFPEEKNGAWIVGIKIENEDTWREIKDGDIAGLSMQGIAAVEPEAPGTFQGEEMPRSADTEQKSIFEKLYKILVDAAKGCFEKSAVNKPEMRPANNFTDLGKGENEDSNSQFCEDKIDSLINKLDEVKDLFEKRMEIIEKSSRLTKQIMDTGVSGNRSLWKWL